MLSRRSLIAAGLTLPAWPQALITDGHAALAPTPDCEKFPSPTPAQTAGPFFIPDTPARQDFTADGDGREQFIGGFLVTPSCAPIADAIIELWHADADGAYDNRGYRFRGHMRTGQNGAYGFSTIRPGRYSFRTPHYHLKVFVGGRRVLTTQLYFPDVAANARDGLFDPQLVMKVDDGGSSARYDLVVAAG